VVKSKIPISRQEYLLMYFHKHSHVQVLSVINPVHIEDTNASDIDNTNTMNAVCVAYTKGRLASRILVM